MKRDLRLGNIDGLAFGARLRQIRESQGISRHDLETRIGVSNDRVRMWETWGNVPSYETFQAIARELGVPIEVLMPQEGQS